MPNRPFQIIILLLPVLAAPCGAWELSGFIAAEARGFPYSAKFPEQEGSGVSAVLQPEFYHEWDDGDQSFLFVPFGRADSVDANRTHYDIRELTYLKAGSGWEARIGIRKVFWGVAESNHLVDIINQTDLVENIDTEDKLGQPMINLALIRDWGTLDIFMLTGFRERTFVGKKGRLRNTRIVVDRGDATYESAAQNTHIDWAARYSHYIGDFDIGLYHFWGTDRQPLFNLRVTKAGDLRLTPHYNIIHQTGTDIQATLGNWLLKFEALRREGQDDTFVGTIGGFEYTFVGVFDTAIDVGALAEYSYDDRKQKALTPFNNDVFVGTRLAMNDAPDTQILAGVVADLDGRANFLNVEASRRFGDRWKLELEYRSFWDVARSDPFYGIERDDYLQIEFARFF